MALTGVDNPRLAKDAYNLFNHNELERLGERFTEDATLLDVPTDETVRSRAGILGFFREFKTAFPDMSVTVIRQAANENYVINEIKVSGTHRGPFRTPQGEIPPTGRSFTVPACEIMKFQDGMITSTRQYYDAATLMGQLGQL